MASGGGRRGRPPDPPPPPPPPRLELPPRPEEEEEEEGEEEEGRWFRLSQLGKGERKELGNGKVEEGKSHQESCQQDQGKLLPFEPHQIRA